MAKDYMDLITDICRDLDLNSYVYEDGENPGMWVLQIESNEDLRVINDELKKKFAELGIDTSGVRQYGEDDNYVDFALGDNSYTYADESFLCGQCYCCYDYSPYYANYYITDGEIFCIDCVKNDPDLRESFVAELINNPKNANMVLEEQDLIDMGFRHLETEYENGWYGQVDDPKQILEAILADNPNAEVVFDVSKTYNPWATSFSVWIR